jgi:ketosteroid isomerase-like protein
MVTAESTSTQTRLIQDWAQHWTSHDIDSLVSLFTDELIYEDVPLGVVNRDKQQLRAFVEGFVRGYPDITVELTPSAITVPQSGSSVARIWATGQVVPRRASPSHSVAHPSFGLRTGRSEAASTTRIWPPCSSRSA